MTRRAFLTGWTAMLAPAQGSRTGFEISGHLSAEDWEAAQGGPFHLGLEFSMSTDPGSPIHTDLLDMRNREVVAHVHVP